VIVVVVVSATVLVLAGSQLPLLYVHWGSAEHAAGIVNDVQSTAVVVVIVVVKLSQPTLDKPPPVVHAPLDHTQPLFSHGN